MELGRKYSVNKCRLVYRTVDVLDARGLLNEWLPHVAFMELILR